MVLHNLLGSKAGLSEFRFGGAVASYAGLTFPAIADFQILVNVAAREFLIPTYSESTLVTCHATKLNCWALTYSVSFCGICFVTGVISPRVSRGSGQGSLV